MRGDEFMGNNTGEKTIKTLLNTAVGLQILYLAGVIFVNIFRKFIIRFFSDGFEMGDEFPIDLVGLGDAIFTSVLLVTFYIIIKNMLKINRIPTGIISVFVGIYTIFSFIIIPIGAIMAYEIYMQFLEDTLGVIGFVGVTALQTVHGMFAFSHYIAVVLLLCGFSMYWVNANCSLNKAVNTPERFI